MKKAEFVAALAAKIETSNAEANRIVDAFAETVVENCRDNGEQIAIPGLGVFKQKVNKSRTGINPLTKEKMTTKESTTIAFRASSGVKVVTEPKKAKKAEAPAAKKAVKKK